MREERRVLAWASWASVWSKGRGKMVLVWCVWGGKGLDIRATYALGSR